jgi:hypothetical protein
LLPLAQISANSLSTVTWVVAHEADSRDYDLDFSFTATLLRSGVTNCLLPLAEISANSLSTVRWVVAHEADSRDYGLDFSFTATLL